MEARVSVIEKRLKSIKRIISVASGKGGVGKSLVASTLALNLVEKGHKVGLLDLDLYGPSSHIILGVKDVFPEEEKGIIPPKIHGIEFMSIVYFSEDKPSAFRGIDITNIIIELLAITQWGTLDYLVIDMPPGIGDETLDVIRFIKKSEFLVVTTPSKVAMGAVSKLLKILKELKIPVIGVLENMKMTESPIIEDSIIEMNLPFIGSIFFDENLEDAIGNGDLLLKTKFMGELDNNLKKTNL
ncbi:AAA domain protein [Thermoplasmatales archaeon SCGC AB-540-F20]|nr:AAA domain protein [Thermoplasmatales archaeon SCGC AB-540-F20]